jgi:hypothetical protein
VPGGIVGKGIYCGGDFRRPGRHPRRPTPRGGDDGRRRGHLEPCVDGSFDARAIWRSAPRSGAVMCPACSRGSRPLALMQSATWLPISFARSVTRDSKRVLPGPGLDRYAITPPSPSRTRRSRRPAAGNRQWLYACGLRGSLLRTVALAQCQQRPGDPCRLVCLRDGRDMVGRRPMSSVSQPSCTLMRVCRITAVAPSTRRRRR